MEKTLQELRSDLYKSQFWEYDRDNQAADDVLETIQKVSSNPKMLEFILACLKANDINPAQELFYIEVKSEKHKKIYTEVLPKIFNNILEADEWARKGTDPAIPERLKFELYHIVKIN